VKNSRLSLGFVNSPRYKHVKADEVIFFKQNPHIFAFVDKAIKRNWWLGTRRFGTLMNKK